MMSVEVKYTDSPKIRKSMKTAIDELSLKNTTIIYPGKEHLNSILVL